MGRAARRHDAKFFRTHPEWRGTAALPEGFHWKWYFAFQQLGDEHVADRVAAYRAGMVARQRWTERLGWLLPGVGVQAALHRQAATDLTAQLAYQDAVAAYHAQLRRFFYPYLFNDVRFGEADFAAQPRFTPLPAPTGMRMGLAGGARVHRGGGSGSRGTGRGPGEGEGRGLSTPKLSAAVSRAPRAP